MKQIITEFGKEFMVDDAAYVALTNAGDGKKAEHAFNELAPHIPRRYRGEVWQAIPLKEVEE